MDFVSPEVLLLIFHHMFADTQTSAIVLWKSFLGCMKVNKHWYQVCQDDDLCWKLLCQRIWGIPTLDHILGYLKHFRGSDWKSTFQNFYAVFGLDMDGFQSVYASVSQILTALGDHVTDYHLEMGYPFPTPWPSLNCFLRLVSQKSQENQGFFGGYSFYDRVMEYFLVKPHTVGSSKQLQYVCFASGHGEKDLGVVLHDPRQTFPVGSVISITHGWRRVCLLAPSFEIFLSHFASSLYSGALRIDEEGFISLFPQSKGSSTLETHGVKVMASPLFISEASGRSPRGPQYLWAYSISLQNISANPCQLLFRHWIITDATGKIEQVNGPGVIGLYPRLNQGAKEFRYESCCPLSTPSGSMKGHFIFKDLTNDSQFLVTVPEFFFVLPEVFLDLSFGE